MWRLGKSTFWMVRMFRGTVRNPVKGVLMVLYHQMVVQNAAERLSGVLYHGGVVRNAIRGVSSFSYHVAVVRNRRRCLCGVPYRTTWAGLCLEPWEISLFCWPMDPWYGTELVLVGLGDSVPQKCGTESFHDDVRDSVPQGCGTESLCEGMTGGGAADHHVFTDAPA